MASIEPCGDIIRVLCSDPEAAPEFERALAERFGRSVDWRVSKLLEVELDEFLRSRPLSARMIR